MSHCVIVMSVEDVLERNTQQKYDMMCERGATVRSSSLTHHVVLFLCLGRFPYHV